MSEKRTVPYSLSSLPHVAVSKHGLWSSPAVILTPQSLFIFRCEPAQSTYSVAFEHTWLCMLVCCTCGVKLFASEPNMCAMAGCNSARFVRFRRVECVVRLLSSGERRAVRGHKCNINV